MKLNFTDKRVSLPGVQDMTDSDYNTFCYYRRLNPNILPAYDVLMERARKLAEFAEMLLTYHYIDCNSVLIGFIPYRDPYLEKALAEKGILWSYTHPKYIVGDRERYHPFRR